MALTLNSNLPAVNAKTTTMKQMTSGPLAVAKFLIDTFSTVRQQGPPTESKTIHVRLITISVSHFCEKVRFVLDHVEANEDNPFYYTEDAHPPGFQAYETLKASGEKSSITPMVIFRVNGEENVMTESPEILKYFMPELYPAEIKFEVEQVETDLAQRLGATVRCFAYYHLLGDVKANHKGLVHICADPNKVAKIESIVFDNVLERGLAKGIKRAVGVHQEAYENSVKALREVFAEWSKRLEESGGEYMMDTTEKSYGFTAADLTLAALASPVLQPPELKAWQLPPGLSMPEDIQSMSEELRATRAGQHALNIYKKHRVPGAGLFVVMKYADRTKFPLPSMRVLGVAGAAAAAVAVGISMARK